MRRLLTVLGAVFLALIVGVVGLIGYVAFVGNSLDKEAKAYVDEAVPAIVADWSVEEMRQRASPEFLRSTKPDDLRSLFVLFAKLGPMVQYGGPKGQATVFASVGSGKTVTASYTAQATFRNGGATIEVVLRQVDGVWKIQSFRVNSPVLIEAAVGRAT